MLDMQSFFIKEHTGMFKTTNSYDILDPESQEKVGLAQEKRSFWGRLLGDKGSRSIEVRDVQDQIVFTINIPWRLFGRPKIGVRDAKDQELGYFQSKMFSMGGGFWVYGADDKQFAEVKGNWKGREFRLVDTDDKELGQVTQKWAGMAKELFTSSDNYVVAVNDEFANDARAKTLVLAAALAIDMVYKED